MVRTSENAIDKKVIWLPGGKMSIMILSKNPKGRSAMEDIAEQDFPGVVIRKFIPTIQADTDKPWYGVEFVLPNTVTVPEEYTEVNGVAYRPQR